jgi:hypothetical protein
VEEIDRAVGGQAVDELEGTPIVPAPTCTCVIDEVSQGVYRPYVDRRERNAVQNVVNGVAPDAYVATLPVSFQTIVTHAIEAVVVNVGLTRLPEPGSRAGVQPVKHVVEGVATNHSASSSGRPVNKNAAGLDKLRAALLYRVPLPAKEAVVEFVVLDGNAMRVALDVDALVVQVEGGVLDEDVTGVIKEDGFGVTYAAEVPEGETQKGDVITRNVEGCLVTRDGDGSGVRAGVALQMNVQLVAGGIEAGQAPAKLPQLREALVWIQPFTCGGNKRGIRYVNGCAVDATSFWRPLEALRVRAVEDSLFVCKATDNNRRARCP